MSMYQKTLIISILLLGLSACERFQANKDSRIAKKEVVMASEAAAPVVQPAKNLLEDRETLLAAKNDLQALPIFAGKPVQVFGNIDFFDGVRPRIELAVQNPNDPDGILLLAYRQGKWSAPAVDEEEELNAKQIAPQLTPLADIHFDDVVEAAHLWRKKAAEVNAVWQEPFHVAFIWMPKLKKRFWHTAEIDAVGAQYYLSMNIDGTIWEWKRIRD